MSLPEKILVVEDEAITQRMLNDILSQEGVEISCVDNASDALDDIYSNSYDMILMDININGAVDGIQLSRKILEKYDIPIVFITAHDDEDTVDELLELSPYGFISKPFGAKEVLIAIKIAYKMSLSKINKVETDNNSNENEIYINDEYKYSLIDEQLFKSGKLVKLTNNQNKLIYVLAKNFNQIVDYETLILEIWGQDTKADSALRTLVYSIRKLLPTLPLHSQSKTGYILKNIKK